MTSLSELGINEIVDCHTHSGGTDTYNFFAGNIPHTQSVEDLALKARQNGVDRVVTFPFPGSSYYNARLLVTEGKRVPSGLQDFPYQVENLVTARDCQTTGQNLIAFACVDPTIKINEQVDSLRKMHGARLIHGLKLHTLASGCTAQELETSGFIDFALEKDLPIIVHSGTDNLSRPENVLNIGKKYPRLRICAAHLAGLNEEVLADIRKTENVFVDCVPFIQLCNSVRDSDNSVSFPNRIDHNQPASSLAKYGEQLTNNFLWGTDEPWTTNVEASGRVRANHGYSGETTVLAELFKISPQVAMAIAVTNPNRFLALEL